MAAVGQIDVLRERNKVLMNQLKEQNEKLERLRVHMRSWERDEEGEAEHRREAEEVTTLAGVDRRPARTALSKPTVRLSSNENIQMMSRVPEKSGLHSCVYKWVGYF